MAKIPDNVELQELYVASRSVLLDALEALADQRDALILVGAQAVYARAGDANLPVAIYTADADLSLDRTYLNDLPLLEQAMTKAGFQLGLASERRQPGQWFRAVEVDGRTVNIPVDLLIAAGFSGSSRQRRSASLPPHDGMAVRQVDGLEVALVDSDVMEIPSLSPSSDARIFEVKVAGIAALLVAKAYKIHDRNADSKRVRSADKDAGDVIRMMRVGDPPEINAVLMAALNHSDDRIRQTASTGLGYLREQFSRPRGYGIEMAERALAGALPSATIRGLATAFMRDLPDDPSNG